MFINILFGKKTEKNGVYDVGEAEDINWKVMLSKHFFLVYKKI